MEKNWDLKARFEIRLQYRHDEWKDNLPVIRFTMNSAKCDTTGETAAYLQFGREIRITYDVTNDFHTGDEVWMTLPLLNNVAQKMTDKFMPKRDRLYVIVTQRYLRSMKWLILIILARFLDPIKCLPFVSVMTMMQAQ